MPWSKLVTDHLQLVQGIHREYRQDHPPRPSWIENTPICHRHASYHTPEIFPSQPRVLRTKTILFTEILGPCDRRALG